MHARHRLSEGESTFVALRLDRRPRAHDAGGGRRLARRDEPLLARLDRSRPLPRPSVARARAAQRAHAQGTHLRADRGAARRAHDFAAREPRRPAGTGTTATPGSGTRRSPCGRCTRSASRPRRTTSSRSSATCSSPGAPQRAAPPRQRLQVLYPVDGIDRCPTRPSSTTSRVRREPPGARGERRLRARTSSTSSGRSSTACSSTRSHATRCRERAWRIVVQAVEAALECWALNRTTASGRAVASRGTSRSPRSCAGSPQTAVRASPLCAARRSARRAGGTRRARSMTTSASTAFAPTGASRSPTAPTSSTRSLLLLPLVRFLPPDDERVRATVLGIADELADGAFVYRYRTASRTDDASTASPRPASRSARSGSSRHSSRSARSTGRRTNCEKLIGSASALGLYRRGARSGDDPAPRELPPGAHPPRAHQRGAARDRGRPAGAAAAASAHAGIAQLVERRRAAIDRHLHDVMTSTGPHRRDQRGPSAGDDEQLVMVANRLPVELADGRLAREPGRARLGAERRARATATACGWAGRGDLGAPTTPPGELDGIRLEAVPLSDARLRGVLPRVLQRHAVAAVPRRGPLPVVPP